MLMSDNTVLLRGHQNVGHIPYQPFWLLLVRIAQFVLATVILGLSAYSGGGYYFYAGYGIGIFSFVWTLLFLLYVCFTSPSLERTNRRLTTPTDRTDHLLLPRRLQ
jgi:hypothetical protein